MSDTPQERHMHDRQSRQEAVQSQYIETEHGSYMDMPEAWATALRDILHRAETKQA